MCIFHFKQFSVEQKDATMKINTDGVLLASFCQSATPIQRILDIGTGTGVIALMLAQKFVKTHITAIDIDEKTIKLAQKNFANAPFSKRMIAQFQNFLTYETDQPFDLLISNPPYFIDALKNDNIRKSNSRHVDASFFEEFFKNAYTVSTNNAKLWLIFPTLQLEKIIAIAKSHNWFPNNYIQIWNFEGGQCIRHITVFSKQISSEITKAIFNIRDNKHQYSLAYKRILSAYFI